MCVCVFVCVCVYVCVCTYVCVCVIGTHDHTLDPQPRSKVDTGITALMMQCLRLTNNKNRQHENMHTHAHTYT